MEDVALKHKQIIKKLSHYENGVVAETMTKMGLIYPVNYGLSMPQIDKIATKLYKDNKLSFYLWQQDERESKLLALKIIDFNLIEKEYLTAIIDGLVNIELAEQAARCLFAKLKHKFEIASILIKHRNNFVKLSGYIVISRVVPECKGDDVCISLLNEIIENLPTDNAIYFRRGLANALLKIGLRNEFFKSKVMEQIETIAVSSPDLSKYLVQEVNHYFFISN